jgi:trk system potassium uptake protein TrkH
VRNRFQRAGSVIHYMGGILEVLGVFMLLPLAAVVYYWGERGDGWATVSAFIVPAAIALLLGLILHKAFAPANMNAASSMLVCAIAWVAAAALGALPFVAALGSSYLDAYFEAMSGFTTTGITVLSGLDTMPRSILLWRSLTQWLGGLGILSFILVIATDTGDAHHVFSAESHKISANRPVPGLSNTIRGFWKIYVLFTAAATLAFILEGMPAFDAFCHSLTALSTGGYSPHDASIDYYRIAGYANFKLIEYTATFVMLLGGINFLVHFRVLRGDVKALWDGTEVRYWWRLIAAFTVLIMIDHLHKMGATTKGYTLVDGQGLEETFRYSIFQVVSLLTTTGFGTKDIGSDFFPALSKQLFLVMMVIGGCVGSTGGGIKVQRIAMLDKLMVRELFRLRVPSKALSELVFDGKIVPTDEVRRLAALFFTWIAILVFGGAITAFFTDHGPLEAMSGMFSALGNIGPSYISVAEMIAIHPIVKVTYIFGMLAGRLELLPVLLLFSWKAWK